MDLASTKQERNMSLALAPQLTPQRELTPQIWTMINQMAPVMWKSRLFGVTGEEAAAAIMLKGYELGLSITASFELIQVVLGKPSLSPRGAMALLLNSPKIKVIKVTRLTDPAGKYVGHECFMARDNDFEYTVRWTMEDAKRAGLVKPDSGWASYPENMCQWRAIGFCADMVAPDVVAGMTAFMKMPEQFGLALTNKGDIIDMKVNQDPPTPVQANPETTVAAPTITLDDLCTIFGAEAVLVANEGIIPMNDEQVATVAMKLAGGK